LQVHSATFVQTGYRQNGRYLRPFYFDTLFISYLFIIIIIPTRLRRVLQIFKPGRPHDVVAVAAVVVAAVPFAPDVEIALLLYIDGEPVVVVYAFAYFYVFAYGYLHGNEYLLIAELVVVADEEAAGQVDDAVRLGDGKQ